MTDRNKIKDKRIWKRMGYEFAMLNDLICHITADSDYNAVMDKKTWDGLRKVLHYLNEVRSKADDRVYKYFGKPGLNFFYGDHLDKARQISIDVRGKVRELLNSDNEI